MSAPRKTPVHPTEDLAPPVTIAPIAAPEPHPLGPLRPIVRRWPIVVGVTALMVAVAIAAGLSQSPTYTANSDVNVGRVDVRVQALPGYVAGAQALASAYSRIAGTDVVVVPLARKLGLTPAQVLSRLTVAPIPDAPIFRVFGTGKTPADAIAFAKAATQQIQDYVTTTDDGQRSLDSLLAQVRAQSTVSAGLRHELADARGRQASATAKAAAPTTVAPSKATLAARKRAKAARDKAIARLEVAYDTSQLKLQTLSGNYSERFGENASTAGIQVVTTPALATSNRNQTLQRLITLGLVVGVLLGAGVALLVDRIATRRSARQV